jgi:hypothetical protein
VGIEVVHYRRDMRLPAAFAFLVSFAFALGTAARADEGDVLIQAGHEGRPASCARFHVAACNLGTSGGGELERSWTPIVADETARALRAAGLRVIRRPADYAGHDVARAAVFLHFDGDATPCGSGASIGYPDDDGSRTLAAGWRRVYGGWFPFRFMPDNFTENEHRYYGFRKVDAPAKMLVEFGEMTCPSQQAWMASRLHELADRLARYLLAALPAR